MSPDDSRLSSIPNAVFQSTSEGCDILLFATLRTDSQASSIEQNVNSMHKSLEVTAEHGIQRVIVLGDVSSLEGRRWKGITQPWESSMGVSINSVHGMGQLIVEVLARSAAPAVKGFAFSITCPSVLQRILDPRNVLDPRSALLRRSRLLPSRPPSLAHPLRAGHPAFAAEIIEPLCGAGRVVGGGSSEKTLKCHFLHIYKTTR